MAQWWASMLARFRIRSQLAQVLPRSSSAVPMIGHLPLATTNV
jgi:hypothetical protein